MKRMTTDLPARILHFPSDRSAGTLHHTPGGLFSLPGQNELGEARGDVMVPAGTFLTLCVDPTGPVDVSGLASLLPDALDGIVIAYVGFKDRDLRYVSGLRDLRLLRLNDINVTDAGLAYLRGLTGLRELQMELIPITDAGIEHLSPLTSLESLEIVQTKITGASFARIGPLTNLRHLTLSIEDPAETVDCESTIILTGDEVAHLRPLHLLETLTFNTDITDAGVRHIGEFTQLHRLWISGRDVTSAGLAHLRRLTHLQRLFLWQTGVTDDGLRHLSSLPDLETLWLTHAPITDAGLDILTGYRGLRELNLDGALVTDAGVARLRSALPECRIYQTDDEFYNDARNRSLASQ